MDKEQERKASDPSTTSPAYEVMAPRWALIDALLGGTEAMREAGETYLPRHQEEEDIGYNDRLNSAVLYNMTEHTLESLTGRPFRSDPEVSSDTPAQVKALLGDVDLQGNALGPFARDWFRSGLAKGFCGVLVDYPRKDEAIKTKADETAAGLRPYWVAVTPDNILAADEETVGGVKRLVHVRIMESVTTRTGFTTETKRRIRVLEPGTVQFFDEEKDKRGKVTWKQGEKFTVDMDEIPMVIWYSTKQQGPLLCKPRLLDLAELNKCHWQSTADQRHILTVCRFPILVATGAAGPTSATGSEADEGITIGPNKVVYIPDSQGSLKYVEHTGAAIADGRQDLQDLERQMASYGGQFLAEQSGDQTATAKAIDTAEATSELAAMVKTFEDAVAKVFYYTAKWAGVADGKTGTIKLDSSWSQQAKTGGAQDSEEGGQGDEPAAETPGAKNPKPGAGKEQLQQEQQS